MIDAYHLPKTSTFPGLSFDMSLLRSRLYSPLFQHRTCRYRGPAATTLRNAAGLAQQKKQLGDDAGKMTLDQQMEVLDALERRGWPADWDKSNSPILLLGMSCLDLHLSCRQVFMSFVSQIITCLCITQNWARAVR